MKKQFVIKQSWLVLIFIIFAFSCIGQEKAKTSNTALSKITKTQGTSQYTNVHCGLQDKTGNLWFGTTGEGVYRYNGKSFTNFTVKNGLSNNTVYAILEDKTGNIWLGTENGICRYNASLALSGGSQPFTSVPITLGNSSNIYTSFKDNPPIKNAVWSIMQAKNGKLWFGTSEGVYCYDGKNFTHFLNNDQVINNSGLHLKMVQSIFEDKNGIIWFGSGLGETEGLCRFDGKSITHVKPKGDGWIRKILEDKNGNLCLATRTLGVCVYDGKNFNNLTEKAGIDNGSICTILKDKAGNIWIATENGSGEEGEDGGLWRYDGKLFTKFTTKDGLSHNSVWCILEDRAGKIWVGTRNNGLCCYNGKTFTDFTDRVAK